MSTTSQRDSGVGNIEAALGPQTDLNAAMPVFELAELIKELEEELGVSAATPMAAMPMPQAARMALLMAVYATRSLIFMALMALPHKHTIPCERRLNC